jgi:lambda family phage tail tape measure protein
MPTEIDQLTIGVQLDTSKAESDIRKLSREAENFSGAISRAFKDAVVGGKSFEAVLASLALRLAGMALDRALSPLTSIIGKGIGSLFAAFGLAKGGVVAEGCVKPFAAGGVVAAPTLFPLARGLGLMGEAGAEAVLPLARGPDGKLGVRNAAGAPMVVNFHVTAADADSFRKSEAQVTAMLARAVGRGRRGL